MMQILNILNIILATSVIWLFIGSQLLIRDKKKTIKILKEKNSIIKNQDALINTQEERIELLKENSNLAKTRLKQCEEIVERQHKEMLKCHNFLFAFIKSTKKEMQSKDREIELIRKSRRIK